MINHISLLYQEKNHRMKIYNFNFHIQFWGKMRVLTNNLFTHPSSAAFNTCIWSVLFYKYTIEKWVRPDANPWGLNSQRERLHSASHISNLEEKTSADLDKERLFYQIACLFTFSLKCGTCRGNAFKVHEDFGA